MQDPKVTEEYVDFEGDLAPKSPFRRTLESFFFGPYFVVVCVLLVGVIAFSLGYYAREVSGDREIKFLNAMEESMGEVKGVSTSTGSTGSAQGGSVASPSNSSGQAPLLKQGQVVASKNGTKYHLPECSGAKQISDKNKITFNSIEEARAAGYSPASNCKGLK